MVNQPHIVINSIRPNQKYDFAFSYQSREFFAVSSSSPFSPLCSRPKMEKGKSVADGITPSLKNLQLNPRSKAVSSYPLSHSFRKLPKFLLVGSESFPAIISFSANSFPFFFSCGITNWRVYCRLMCFLDWN